jgi:myo-inositol-1-phosphate synthase
MIAGAKGAVGSTVVAAITRIGHEPHAVLPWLTTEGFFDHQRFYSRMKVAGWDVSAKPIEQSIRDHGVLDAQNFFLSESDLSEIEILQAPSPEYPVCEQIGQLIHEMDHFKKRHPENHPVLINLLPAFRPVCLDECEHLEQLCSQTKQTVMPDLIYALAAVMSAIPVVNFTSNAIEIPLLLSESLKVRVPLCGRDGKTGQTYLKVVIASALKARRLRVNGWYSLNILGNNDGENLADPDKASEKVANKTKLLEEILGYKVGQQYGAPSHKVTIDYYPPRGDNKEAWDVIDFSGLFGLPMSLRLNLQGRDSILAAPLVMDLAVWMAALHCAGRRGLVPELGFYFKKPLGSSPPVTFEAQLRAIRQLAVECKDIT